MSPWARASPIRTLVTADCSVITPPSSSGTPSMLTPSSFAWSRISFGVSRSSSAFNAAGRIWSAAKAVQQVGAREAVERPQAEAHPALRHPLVLSRSTHSPLFLPDLGAVLELV